MGFDLKVLGRSRIDGISERVRKQAKHSEGFKDTRAEFSGRPRTKDLTQEELIERQKQEIELLRAKLKYLSL